MPSCPSCGKDVAADFRVCPYCATPLAAAPAPREERKVVTVLFCDLVGSTAQAERLDPEDVRALLSRYHEHVRGELERFGGTVEKFIGDAVMALFGAPAAHEDDPERAVRAALAIRDWAADAGGLQVRIGVTTGEALVALGADPLAGEGMASGDVVNTAARLQSAAAENGIIVDTTTYRASERAIEYAEHAPVQAKGKAEPIPVWEARQARSRFGVDVRQETAAPLVGRESELDVLVRTLDRARREREPQLVTLVGVPGIGKSRLVYELFRHLEDEPDLTTWRQGRSLPYGEGVSFWALGEMVKAQAGILDTDDSGDAATKLRASVDELGLPNADWVAKHLAPLVGVHSEEAAHGEHAEAFTAWRDYLEALADRRPLVLVFEDLHSADDGLLDFVDELVEWTSDVPLLVVGTARPELLTRRSGWGGGKPNATTLSLGPLSHEDTSRIVHALLERAVLPADVQATLLERAEGNPLYAEEFARLVADGREPHELPETVQGLIAARLDALAPEEKELLQSAAVIGKVFWSGAAAQLVDIEPDAAAPLLHALVRRELTRRERRASIEGQTEFVFRHSLVRDVAYAQIPRAVRFRLHRRAAEWLERSGRPDDQVELLAHHYAAALDLAAAAGEGTDGLGERAREAFRAAGERAQALYALTNAAAFFARALALAHEDDPGYPYLLLAAGQTSATTSGRGEELLREASERLGALGDRTAAAEAELALANTAWYRGDGETVAVHRDRAASFVADVEPSQRGARVLAQLARLTALTGQGIDVGPAIDLARKALSLARELDLTDVEADASITIGSSRGGEGDLEGMADIERGIALAEAGDMPTAARGYNNLAWLRWLNGDAESRETNGRALQAARRFGLSGMVAFQSVTQVTYLYSEGDWEQALAILEEPAEARRGYMDAVALMTRALIRLGRGRTDEALSDARAAVDRSRVVGGIELLRAQLAAAAAVELVAGDRREAVRLVDELGQEALASNVVLAQGEPAFRLIEELGSREEVAAPGRRRSDTPRRRAALAYLDGDFERAAAQFAESREFLHEARTRQRAGERLLRDGRRAEAEEQLGRALAFYRSAGATRYIREVEALLAEAAPRAG